MHQWTPDMMTVERQLHLPVATIQIARLDVQPAVHETYTPVDIIRLDLCLTRRPIGVQACFPNRWGARRYENIGRLFAIPAGESVDFRSDGGSPVEIICEIQSEAARQWIGHDIEWTAPRLQSTLDIANERIASILSLLGQELQFPSIAQSMMAELLIGQLSIEFGRHFSAIESEFATGGLSVRRLRLIDERLENVSDPPSLDELARLCEISIRQLTRGFLASRGRSIGTHVAERRIDGAKALLGGDLSIKSIAYQLGFASPSAFSQAFRRSAGETPRQFRSRHLKNQF